MPIPCRLFAFFSAFILPVLPAVAADPTPPDFKIAILGDQGLGTSSEAVLTLVKNEGAKMLVHVGDFDYSNNPTAWDAQTTKILGPDFLQVSVMGNHDATKWNGPSGYGALIASRMSRMGVPIAGTVGKQCAFNYKGIFFVMTTPGLEGSGHDAFIKQQLAQDNSIWRLSVWHVNQNKMQGCSKSDEAGWAVYEESRLGGAIMAQGHEHSYVRTHLLSNFTNQTVADTSSTLHLKKGASFTAVSGLAGRSLRTICVKGPWFASQYSGNYGALFATFNVGGVANKANFYFKDIQGKVIDKFDVISEVNQGSAIIRTGADRFKVAATRLGMPSGHRIEAVDLTGRKQALQSRGNGETVMMLPGGSSGILILRDTKTGKAVKKIAVLP